MTRPVPQPLAAVWFDLDGTLVDSAPDLYAAVQALCDEHGLPLPPYGAFRAHVSRGGSAMVRTCLGDQAEAAVEQYLARFLELYASRLHVDTLLFDGMARLLDQLEARDIAWGVITNKSTTLAEPLLHELGLHERAAACVYGDTLAVRKPEPEPLLHACQQAGVAAQACVYVGDDERDMQAAQAAGMPGIAAAWGYLGGGDPLRWGADHVVDQPVDLERLLVSA